MSPADAPIRAWHVCVAGFLQTEGEPTGIVRLWRRLHQQHSDPRTRVELRSWADRTDTLAELIWRLRPDNHPPLIRLYGYSWGGAACVRLARDLQKRGLPVASMVLSDAVYRHPYWAGNWRAFVPLSRLVVPANVREVFWFRQQNNWPSGHTLVAAYPQTVIHPAHVIGWFGHQYMDDLDEFHRLAEHVARGASEV